MSEEIKTPETSFFQAQVSKLPPYWKIATIRCGAYAAVVGWNTFSSGVEGYNSFADMTSMQFYKLFGNISIAMLSVWIAFLDQSMGQLHSGQQITSADIEHPPVVTPVELVKV